MNENEPETLFQTPLFRVVRKSYETPDGRTHVRQIVCHPGAVAILPVLDDGRICMIENFRITAGRMLLELPAGTREPNEEPIETARRELTEETGYRAGLIEPINMFFVSPGVLDEQMHLFLATQLTPGEQDLQGGEQIAPRLVAWEEAVRLIRDGTVQDAKTLVGLLYYGAFLRR
ncbi:MAG TPA: NUDIX hydrolase [Planctomycetaceae bacterium]|nr:NUDIX hydrolase [Planctomycetaceae bacterium]